MAITPPRPQSTNTAAGVVLQTTVCTEAHLAGTRPLTRPGTRVPVDGAAGAEEANRWVDTAEAVSTAAVGMPAADQAVVVGMPAVDLSAVMTISQC